MTLRVERQRENEEWKRKYTDLEKKNLIMEKKNTQQMFRYQTDCSKWGLERTNLFERIKALEDSFEWEKNKNQLTKSKNEIKKSESSSHFNLSEYSKFSNVRK